MYSRELPEVGVLTLGASGWTYKNTFVLWDRETGSMWYHLSGTDGLTCISGALADEKLEEFVSVVTRWSTWRAMAPETKFLKYP